MADAATLDTDAAVLRDRLVAALLEDSRIQLVGRDANVYRLQTDRGAGIAVVLGDPPEALAATLAALVAVHRAGELHLLAVGGGPETARALKHSAPFLQMSRRFGFHQLGPDGQLAHVTGATLWALPKAIERLPTSAPLTEEALALRLAQSGKLLEETAKLDSALRGRFPTVTLVIGVVCIALFVIGQLWRADGGFDVVLMRMGANSGALVEAGEVWRVLASAFLHLNWEHILVNMIALASFGPILERLLGVRRYLLLYGLSALGGGVASAYLSGAGFSVGASGAIWGLMTAGVGLALRPRGLLPPVALASARKRAAAPLVINILYSFMPGIDLHGHFGGGIVGLLLMVSGAVTYGVEPIWAGPPAQAPPPRRSILLTAGAWLISLAMIGSVGIAIGRGKPWALAEPVVFERVPLGDTGFTLEMPAPIAAKPDDKLRLTYQTSTFGDLAQHPIVVEVISSSLGAVPADPDAAMKALGEQVDSLTVTGAERVGEMTTVTIDGKTWFRLEHRVNTVTMRTWASIVGDREVLLRVYARPDRPSSWKGVEEKIVASVRSR